MQRPFNTSVCYLSFLNWFCFCSISFCLSTTCLSIQQPPHICTLSLISERAHLCLWEPALPSPPIIISVMSASDRIRCCLLIASHGTPTQPRLVPPSNTHTHTHTRNVCMLQKAISKNEHYVNKPPFFYLCVIMYWNICAQEVCKQSNQSLWIISGCNQILSLSKSTNKATLNLSITS